MIEPDKDVIDRASWAWRNSKDRETDSSDTAYFREHWRHLPGLRFYVEREMSALPHKDPTHD